MASGGGLRGLYNNGAGTQSQTSNYIYKQSNIIINAAPLLQGKHFWLRRLEPIQLTNLGNSKLRGAGTFSLTSVMCGDAVECFPASRAEI